MVGMMEPNWLDQKYQMGWERATAEECLAEIAKDSQIVKNIKDALATHDAQPGLSGPSRTQVIRSALAHTLQAMS